MVSCELSGSDISQINNFALNLYNGISTNVSLEEAQNLFCSGWDQPQTWDPLSGGNPAGAVYYDNRTGTTISGSLSYDFELVPGRWAFTFIGKYSDIDEKDRWRGCVLADLVPGPNPQVRLKIKEIEWPLPPSICGDGIIDNDELCDDGNTADDATCMADCLSLPVFQVNIVTAGSQYEPSIAGAGGTYVVSWTSSGSMEAGENSLHVRGRRLDLYGQGLPTGIFGGDADFRINTRRDQSQFQPSVAIGIGRFMTLWVDTDSNYDSYGDIVWRITNFDNVSTPVEQVLNVGSSNGTQDWGRVAGAGGAKFFAAWISSNTTPRSAICSMFNSGSEAWIPEYTCSASSSDNETQVEVGMSPRGVASATWLRNNNIYIQFFNEDGQRVGSEKQVNTQSGGVNDYPVVAFDGQGRALVAWRYQPPSGNIEIRGRLFDEQGSPVGQSDFLINSTPLTGSASIGSNQNYLPDVAGDPQLPQFLVVWDAPAAGGGRGRIVLGDNDFGVNRFVRNSPDEPFTSKEDFPIVSQEPYLMDQLAVACGSANFCMVVWSDQSLASDTDAKGIRGTVIPTLQPE